MKTLFVTGYVKTGSTHRDQATYLALGRRLLSIGLPIIAFIDSTVDDLDVPDSVTVLPASLSSCWLYSDTRNAATPKSACNKDTVDYMVVVQQKTAWIKAVVELFDCDVVVWVDFGILHLPGVNERHIKRFFDHIVEINIEKITAPSIWPLTPEAKINYSNPAWYFAGGVVVVPASMAEWFHKEAKKHAIQYLRATKLTTWEVNTWAEIARKNTDKFLFWPADHNQHLFIGFINSSQAVSGTTEPSSPKNPTKLENKQVKSFMKKCNNYNPVRLCLNMIVRDESKIVERALASVAEVINCCVIGDTGSQDETINIIESFCKNRGIPCEIHQFSFANFSQARNEALACARESSLEFDYLLLFDADMELVVEDPRALTTLNADAFLVKQDSGSLRYDNIRLLRRNASACYVGATHEGLVVEGITIELNGVHFIDHADGASRPGKLARDEELLRRELEKNPGDVRGIYYLAQTLRDAGRYADAAIWYAKRFAAGGWEEERWHARYQQALCELHAGNPSAFVEGCLLAYALRPHRAEPLYSLVKYYTDTGLHDTALLFAEQIAKIAWPKTDRLFIEPSSYADVLTKTSAISGFYSAIPERREIGRLSCEALAIDPCVALDTRWNARRNLFYYTESVTAIFPGTELKKIPIELPEPFVQTNPSFVSDGTGYIGVVRGVNYTLKEGCYSILDIENIIRTRNFIAHLDADLSLVSLREIHEVHNLNILISSRIRGFEDCRLFRWKGGWWCSATARDLNYAARATMVLLRLDHHFDFCDAFPLEGFADDQHQKNWMPFADERLKFIYSCGPTVLLDASLGDGSFTVESIVDPGAVLDHWRGGGQLIVWGEGFLAIVHEARDTEKGREYIHRFVAFDNDYTPIAATPAFYFCGLGIEFAAGLTVMNDSEDLLVSFGVGDCEAWLAKVPRESILSNLQLIDFNS